MGYIFFWLECMASALALVAVVFSFTGRYKKWQAVAPMLIAVILIGLGVLATTISGYMFFDNILPQWLFPYTLSWTLLFIVGSWILIRRGCKKTGETLTAASWSRCKCIGALLILLTLQWTTLDTLDNASKLKSTGAQTLAMTRAQTIMPSPPAREEDAAEIYKQAEKEMGKMPDWLWQASTDPAFDPQSDKANNLLRDKRKAIALLKEASRKPRLYHPQTLTFDSELPAYVPFRNGTDLLALEARNFARKGKMAAALENISDIDKIAVQVNQTPSLINAMIASGIHSKSKSTLEIILTESSGHSKIVVNLPVKTHDQILQGLRKGLVFEDAMQDFGMADLLINHPDESLLGYGFSKSYWAGFENKLYRVFFYPDDLASHGVRWKKIRESTQKPYYQSGQELMEWENRSPDNSMLGFLTSIRSIWISKYFKRVTRHQTEFLLGKLALAAAAYRSGHGKYPATPDALMPKYITEIPIDPFSGEPLKMLAVDGGLILYGVGENLKDDGGLAYDDIEKTGDIAFYFGSAFKEHRLKPAIEEMRNRKEKEKNKKKKK